MSKDYRKYFRSIHYRPFDVRTMWYDPDIVDWPRTETMGQFDGQFNIALLSPRMTADAYSPLVSDKIISNKTGSRYDQTYFFPLYIVPNQEQLDQGIRLNFRPKLFAAIRKAAGLTGTPSAPKRADAFRRDTGDSRSDEVKVFDYIYGVLHSPAYRATYAEFLKMDFPRIPFPASPQSFRDISEKGENLRRLHLMEAAVIGEAPHPFHGEGDSVVEKPRYEKGRVWINADQYFDGVPSIAWEFYIGGYQPAQKWLKDRNGHSVTYDDVRHYQRIIKILVETDRIMRTIELPL